MKEGRVKEKNDWMKEQKGKGVDEKVEGQRKTKEDSEIKKKIYE